jgi:hypothetical protein
MTTHRPRPPDVPTLERVFAVDQGDTYPARQLLDAFDHDRDLLLLLRVLRPGESAEYRVGPRRYLLTRLV